jgi:hypothetical protein
MLLGLYGSTDIVEAKQAQWLEVCKRLVQTIPGLSSIINTQTGEVKGGAVAAEKYLEAWRDVQEKTLYWKAYYAKRDAQIEQENQLRMLEIEAGAAQIAYDRARQQHPEFATAGGQALAKGEFGQEGREYLKVWQNVTEAQKRLTAAREAMAGVDQQLADEKQYLIDKYGEEEQAATAAGEATSAAFDADKAAAVKTVIDNVENATKALKDYTDQVFNSTKKGLEGVLGGFNDIQYAQQKASNLKDLMNGWNSSEDNPYTKLFKDAQNAIPTIQNMTEALDHQLQFLNDYYDNLARLREMGYSDQVIAMVSDGSVESAARAKALAEGSKEDRDKINRRVKEVQDATDKLAGTLTENKLTVDEKAKELTADWEAAMASLDQHDTAKAGVANTMQGIIEGLGEGAESVRTQVQSILDMLAELSNAKYTIPNIDVSGMGTSGGNGLNIEVHNVTTLDGRTLSQSVSQHQADQLNQINRSGGVLE